jgi:hypothetical protein
VDLIILKDGLYYLYPVTKELLVGIELTNDLSCFDLCDILREKLTIYKEDINRHILKNGSFFFGCFCR